MLSMILLVAFFAAVTAVVVSTFIMSSAFDELVEQQFAKHKDQWVNSGKPIGGKNSRQNASFWLSGLASPLVLQQWLSHPPEWAVADEHSLRLVGRMRAGFVGLLVSTILALLAMYFFGRSTAA